MVLASGYPKVIIMILVAAVLAAGGFAGFCISQAAAAGQYWFLTDQETDVNGADYVMYKGVDDNSDGTVQIVPDDSFRIWVADEAAQCDLTFNENGCLWRTTISLEGTDKSYTSVLGKIADSTFVEQSGDLTLNAGEWLALKIGDDTEDDDNYDLEVFIENGDYDQSRVKWTCDSPPYPVPDAEAWSMFAAGTMVIGLLGWGMARRKSANRQQPSD